ncbi:uncharacterized protein [Hyperolius riggenbachi]|uniref:uncharacterized protein isoform X2 n=1 Tax=Hyperolius riggenbachi TaxID=752182 RepID=UPI0035A32F38
MVKQKKIEQSKDDSGKKVVILIWDMMKYEDLTLLTDPLLKKSLGASCIPVSHYPEDQVNKYLTDRSSHIIFYYSMNLQQSLEDLMSFLKINVKYLICRENVNVIITDLEDTAAARELEMDWNPENGICCPLLTLTRSEVKGMKECQNCQGVRKNTEKEKTLLQILRHARKSPAHRNVFKQISESPKLKIRIFSRSHIEDYAWFWSLLRSENFGDQMEDIKESHISNDGFSSFKTDVESCTFAILYHSMTRGRVNVTDVEGALYDKELQYLNEHLGRKKVIVVIDDVEDSSIKEKDQIFQTQPSIRLAQDLFLFSKVEKATDYVTFLPSFKKKKKRLEAMILGNTDNSGQDHNRCTSEPVSCPHLQHLSSTSGKEGSSQIEEAMEVTESTSSKILSQDESSAKLPNDEKVTRRDLFQFLPDLHLQNVTKNKPASSKQQLNDDQKMAVKTPVEDHRSTAATECQTRNSKQHCIQKPSQESIEDPFSQIRGNHVVGVFSISSEEDYRWMVDLLTPRVRKVHSCCISHEGFHHFMDDVERCTHGIIYHTITRGRINISDVPDALYDRHLEYMSNKRGKKNVTVVIDDLQDTSERERDRILQNQPSIGKLANNLILISKQQKTMYREKPETKQFQCRTSRFVSINK